jgi:hypothetical protein
MMLQMPALFQWSLKPDTVIRFEHLRLLFVSLPMFYVEGAAQVSGLAQVILQNLRLETLLCGYGFPLLEVAGVQDHDGTHSVSSSFCLEGAVVSFQIATMGGKNSNQ